MEGASPEFCCQLLFDPRSKPLIHSQITIINNVPLHQLLKKCSQEEKTACRSCLFPFCFCSARVRRKRNDLRRKIFGSSSLDLVFNTLNVKVVN